CTTKQSLPLKGTKMKTLNLLSILALLSSTAAFADRPDVTCKSMITKYDAKGIATFVDLPPVDGGDLGEHPMDGGGHRWTVTVWKGPFKLTVDLPNETSDDLGRLEISTVATAQNEDKDSMIKSTSYSSVRNADGDLYGKLGGTMTYVDAATLEKFEFFTK